MARGRPRKGEVFQRLRDRAARGYKEIDDYHAYKPKRRTRLEDYRYFSAEFGTDE